MHVFQLYIETTEWSVLKFGLKPGRSPGHSLDKMWMNPVVWSQGYNQSTLGSIRKSKQNSLQHLFHSALLELKPFSVWGAFVALCWKFRSCGHAVMMLPLVERSVYYIVSLRFNSCLLSCLSSLCVCLLQELWQTMILHTNLTLSNSNFLNFSGATLMSHWPKACSTDI